MSLSDESQQTITGFIGEVRGLSQEDSFSTYCRIADNIHNFAASHPNYAVAIYEKAFRIATDEMKADKPEAGEIQYFIQHHMLYGLCMMGAYEKTYELAGQVTDDFVRKRWQLNARNLGDLPPFFVGNLQMVDSTLKQEDLNPKGIKRHSLATNGRRLLLTQTP